MTTTPQTPTPAADLAELGMKAQDEAALFVAAMSGIRAQFIDAGWTPAGAEAMVLETVRQGTGK